MGRLAGQTNVRIRDGQVWSGIPYDLLEPWRYHQEQVEKPFSATVCQAQDGPPVFVCDGDDRTTDTKSCRARVLRALLKAFPPGLVEFY